MSYAKIQIVELKQKGRGVICQHPIVAGELICTGKPLQKGVFKDSYSFQTESDFHVQLDEPARVFNHSCEPNLSIRDNSLGGFDFFASRPIMIGEELTWHYGMSEAYSIAVKRCCCGSKHCLGRSYGFLEAPAWLQNQLYSLGCAEYLKTWFELKVLQRAA